MLKLYYSRGTCSLSPHIILRETGTPFELVKVSFATRKTEDGRDYLAINPLGYVPALELDDGTILLEGPAIVQYIADQAGATQIAPPCGTLARSQMQQWLNFVSTELHKMFWPFFHMKPEDPGRKPFADELHKRFAFLDKHLSANAYLMGDGYTLPDAYAFTILMWPKSVSLDMSSYQHIAAYRQRVGERPAVRAALEAEGIGKH